MTYNKENVKEKKVRRKTMFESKTPNVEFRGKRKDDGKWIYGYYVEDREGPSILYRHPDGSLDRKKVIPKTAGQYVGIKDRHKKKVYTGDILNVYDSFLAIVENHYALQLGGSVKDFRISFDTMAEIEEFEIVGNVHENPELLSTGRW
jgi:hypothetical protein